MNKGNFLIAGGAAALSLGLIALPGTSAKPERWDDSTIARWQQKFEELQDKLQAKRDDRQNQYAKLAADVHALEASARALAQENQDKKQLDEMPGMETKEFNLLIGGEGPSWLGVETQEVTADKAKELKLPAERGVVLGKIVPDSPAAKAGLKENDVVTEMNGQRVEGAAQFRRMIHEIPAGRTAQLTVWRDGRAQTLNVTLGKAEERHHAWRMAAPAPGTFSFHVPEVMEIPEIPSMDWSGNLFFSGQPRLGIDAEDLSGQLGTFFGAPDGEGILVREVNSSSPAEKAGLKAGDVITSFNGERIRSVGDLREKLSAKRDDKDKTVKLGILRNKSQMTLNVELPPSPARSKRVIRHRTNI